MAKKNPIAAAAKKMAAAPVSNSTVEVKAAVKKAYTKKGNKVGDIKTIEIYVKPEESAAYYVVNGVGADDYKIEL